MMIFAANISYAVELELSDVIKEARKAESLRLSQANKESETIQPVKNETQSLNGERSACEKINPEEILNKNAENNYQDKDKDSSEKISQ